MISKTIFVIIFILSALILAIQYREYNNELEKLNAYIKYHNNIFKNKSYNVENTKIDDAFAKVKNIDNKLKAYNAVLPMYDNANNFIKNLKENSYKTNTEIKIIKNNRLKKEFFNENFIVFIIKGKKESLKEFSDLSELIEQLHTWKESSQVMKSRDSFQVKVSLYSQDEDGYGLTHKSIDLPTIESKVWLPYLSTKSTKNIDVINTIGEKFTKYKKEVEIFYLYLDKENTFIDMEIIIDIISKDRNSFSNVLE